MYNYVYELHRKPLPPNEWATGRDFSDHPDIFPSAQWIGSAEDRDHVIARFGSWLEKSRLGKLDGEAFIVDMEAADHYFEGRFSAFQKAVAALQALNEMQFVHEHDMVQGLIDDLCETFTQKYGDYVLEDHGAAPVPLDEFIRKAQPGVRYYIGAVLNYKH